jgi:hypothetical protein
MVVVADQQSIPAWQSLLAALPAVVAVAGALFSAIPAATRRRQPLQRPIIAISTDLFRPHTNPASLASRARDLRQGLAAFGLSYFLYGIASVAVGATFGHSRVLALVGLFPAVLGALYMAKAANVDVHSPLRSAFSRHRAVRQLELLAVPSDLVAEWQAVLDTLGFQVEVLSYEPDAGRLALIGRRASLWRAALTMGWDQYVVVHGEVREGHRSAFIVLVDSAIPLRRDADHNPTTLNRLLRHFTIPYRPRPTA